MSAEFEWRVESRDFRRDLPDNPRALISYPLLRRLNEFLSSSKTAVALKLATAVLGVQIIFTAWDILARTDYAGVFPLSFLCMPAAGIIWLTFLISGGERLHGKVDPSGSRKLMAWTILARLFVLTLANYA